MDEQQGLSRRASIAGAAGIGLGGLAAQALGAQGQAEGGGTSPAELAVLWSSGDPDVAHRVCLMYAHAAKTNRWFERVRLIIWGPSQRILVGDKDLRTKIDAMRSDGVIIEACIACATSFGLVDELRDMHLPVKPMGAPLTQFLKDPAVAVISF